MSGALVRPERERIPCEVHPSAGAACAAAANCIARLIRRRQEEGRRPVLGLATGSTAVGVYAELVRLHREEGLSFRDVVTFNLDEYYPMQPGDLQSYVRFMHEHLFDAVDIDPSNIHIPDGTLPRDRVQGHCAEYEAAIREAGGIDLQLLGIGRTGHVGFNEPGSPKTSRTRLITLDEVTRLDAAADFFGVENVPRRAVTMGVGTILEARQILLLAFAEHKAPIVARSVEGDLSPSVPATYLQEHPDARVFLDEASAACLTRCRCPWVLGTPCDWHPRLVRKAVLWLAQEIGKPILKLTEADYNEHALQDLLAEHGPAYDMNLSVFRQMQATVTGWPGGKPKNVKQPGDRPQPFDDIHPKRVLVFAPHPDDDVISMGGTLIRLADQGHEVHVAVQTSGNLAVFDDDAFRYAEFVADWARSFGGDTARVTQLEAHVEEFLRRKKPGQLDSAEVRTIKGLIRRGEARAAGRSCGIPEERMHFLDMPFYETGRVRKLPLGPADKECVRALLKALQPHQIYAAGDLSDPHGTHRTCLRAVLQACQDCQAEAWFASCVVWLYRGAWQEWAPHEIDMAVPLSPHDVERKRGAIFKHQSQKDRPLFPGSDRREFWQRAEQRNVELARLYDALGLPEYQAMEGFVRWDGKWDET